MPSPALAQRQLHERVIDPGREDSPLVEQPAEGQNPAALRMPGTNEEVSEPSLSPELHSGEQSFQATNMTVHDGQPRPLNEWRPDLQTARTADELAYHSSFTPSIAPHKRLGVLDQVSADYTLRLSSPALEDVPVGGQPSDDRDLFWGSVVVRFVPNRPVPIPSVAPEARILSVRTRPEVPVSFFRDGADNFYIASSQAGQCRVVFVTDAPATYFGGPLPGQVRASDVPAELRPTLPANVARAAAEVARRLGLDPQAPVARNLPRLVTYLRSFETLPLEELPQGADPYITLALGRRGVCRHRAFVFVVTAQGLGLPARFVTNEVHAFSEVFIPTVGWVRIDLGGEARLSPESEPTVRHEPRSPDPFPWPPGSETPPPRPAGTATAQNGSHGQGGNGGRPGEGQEGAEPPEPVPDPQATEGQVTADSTVPDGQQQAAPAEPPDEPTSPQPRRLSVVLERYSGSVVRGEALPVSGVARSAEGPVPGALVTVWLRGGPQGRSHRLGRATCDADGRFDALFGVPSTIPTGDYVIAASADESETSR